MRLIKDEFWTGLQIHICFFVIESGYIKYFKLDWDPVNLVRIRKPLFYSYIGKLFENTGKHPPPNVVECRRGWKLPHVFLLPKRCDFKAFYLVFNTIFSFSQPPFSFGPPSNHLPPTPPLPSCFLAKYIPLLKYP